MQRRDIQLVPQGGCVAHHDVPAVRVGHGQWKLGEPGQRHWILAIQCATESGVERLDLTWPVHARHGETAISRWFRGRLGRRNKQQSGQQRASQYENATQHDGSPCMAGRIETHDNVYGYATPSRMAMQCAAPVAVFTMRASVSRLIRTWAALGTKTADLMPFFSFGLKRGPAWKRDGGNRLFVITPAPFLRAKWSIPPWIA
jgi:hypothetical protein